MNGGILPIYNMQNKKQVIILVCLFTFLSAGVVLADASSTNQGLSFTPAMPIPGFEITSVDGSTLAKYIVAVYRYGGIFAGAVAMFMLVYAGWEWLLAGGNASKISSAREKINTTLIGLALLFGGYILLSLISKNLVNFQDLSDKLVLPSSPCNIFLDKKNCPDDHCYWIDPTPTDLTGNPNYKGVCSAAAAEPSCSAKTDESSCTSLSGICKWDSNKCVLQSKCDVSEADYRTLLSSGNMDYALHCCAIRRFPEGYSGHRYAIYGDETYHNSCTWVCGSGSVELSREECVSILNWGNPGASGQW